MVAEVECYWTHQFGRWFPGPQLQQGKRGLETHGWSTKFPVLQFLPVLDHAAPLRTSSSARLLKSMVKAVPTAFFPAFTHPGKLVIFHVQYLSIELSKTFVYDKSKSINKCLIRVQKKKRKGYMSNWKNKKNTSDSK